MPEPVPFIDYPAFENGRTQTCIVMTCQECHRHPHRLVARENDWLCVGCAAKRPSILAVDLQRAVQAAKIADRLWGAFQGDLTLMDSMTDKGWEDAAYMAKVPVPTAQTKCLVRDLLESRGATAVARG